MRHIFEGIKFRLTDTSTNQAMAEHDKPSI